MEVRFQLLRFDFKFSAHVNKKTFAGTNDTANLIMLNWDECNFTGYIGYLYNL